MKEKFADLYSENIKQMKASAIREICKLIAKPEVISLAGSSSTLNLSLIHFAIVSLYSKVPI